MRDPLPIRLGGLAANLARMRSFSMNESNRAAVVDLFDESKFFIEWTAIEADTDIRVRLAELQRVLARWQLSMESSWRNESFREELAVASASWSKSVLKDSGLVA